MPRNDDKITKRDAQCLATFKQDNHQTCPTDPDIKLSASQCNWLLEPWLIRKWHTDRLYHLHPAWDAAIPRHWIGDALALQCRALFWRQRHMLVHFFTVTFNFFSPCHFDQCPRVKTSSTKSSRAKNMTNSRSLISSISHPLSRRADFA